MGQATRKENVWAARWQAVRLRLPFVALLSVMALTTLGAGYLQSRFRSDDEFRVQRVRLMGTLRQVQVADVMGALALRADTPVLAVDLPELTDRIAALPWIKSVAIRRVVPGELHVQVSEREPVLRLNNDALVDRDGNAFQPDNVAMFAHLPRVQTPEAQLPQALDEFARSNTVLAPLGLAVSELELTGRSALTLVLNNGIRLMFGREDWNGRLQRFVALYPDLTTTGQVPTYIDLRYDTGLAVAWPQTKTPDTKSSTQTAGL